MRWDLALEGTPHRVEVSYARLTGFMSLEVDGRTVAREFRQYQTNEPEGGVLEHELDGHKLVASVTLVSGRFGSQTYRCELSVDGSLVAGGT